jgi:hypothetical protein
MVKGLPLLNPYFMGDNMLHKTVLITSAMGIIAFGFLCFMQMEQILTELNSIICYEDIGFTTLWIPDLAILVLTSIASALCLSVLIIEVTRNEN